MNLSPMRFKTFVWPHNPTVYSITFERKMAAHKIPFGRHHLQSLGQTRRVFRGGGEFVGEGAYDTFKELATLFYEETPGVLIHPVWMAAEAWFVGLKLEQEPRSDYVRYTFEFWEVIPGVHSDLTYETQRGDGADGAEVWHTVTGGETIWSVVAGYGTSVKALLALNPGMANPNLIFPGQKVRVK